MERRRDKGNGGRRENFSLSLYPSVALPRSLQQIGQRGNHFIR